LKILAEELAKLRQKLKEETTDAQNDLEIGEFAAAEIAAKKGDKKTVMEHLSRVGKWTLERATDIGVAVAVSAIKTALGL
jgi:hypothetical protein